MSKGVVKSQVDIDVDQARANLTSLTRSFKQQKVEALNLANAYRNLSQEQKNSQSGRQLAQDMEDAIQKASQLYDTKSDIMSKIKNEANDTFVLSATTQTINTLVSTLQVGAGVASAFGVEESKVAEIQQKLTSLIAITNGLTSIQSALQKESAMMSGLQAAKTTILNTVTAVKTALTEKDTIATRAAAVAQEIWNNAIKANPIMALISVLTMVVGAVLLFNDTTKDEETQNKKTSDAVKDHEKALDKLRETTTHAVQVKQDLITKYDVLNQRITLAKGNHEKEIQVVKDYNKELGNVGGTVKDFGELQQKMSKDVYKAIEQYCNMEIVQYKLTETSKTIAQLEGSKERIQKVKEEAEEKLNIQREADRKEVQDRIKYLKSYKDNNTDRELQRIEDIKREEKKLQSLQGNVQIVGGNIFNSWNKVNKELKDAYSNQEKYKKELVDLKNKEVNYGQLDDKNKTTYTTTPKPKPQPTQALNIQSMKPQTDSALQLFREGFLQNIGSVQELTDKVKYLKEQLSQTSDLKLASDLQIQINNTQGLIDEFNRKVKEISEGGELVDGGIVIPVSFDLPELEPIEIKVDNKDLDKTRVKFKDINDCLGQTGGSLKQVGDTLKGTFGEGISIMGLIMQAVATIIQGFATASAKDSKLGVFGWIAATAAGLATLVTTVAQIKDMGKYAEGGVIGGTSTMGDRLIAHVNSGERILTKQQNDKLNSFLNNGVNLQGSTGEGTIVGETRIKGSDLYVSLKNYSKTNTRSKLSM